MARDTSKPSVEEGSDRKKRMSRREFLRNSGTTGAAIVVSVSAAKASTTQPVRQAALQPGRMPKPDAAYQDMPKDTQRCADCVLFIAPNACATVAGEISPNGWCKFFAAR